MSTAATRLVGGLLGLLLCLLLITGCGGATSSAPGSFATVAAPSTTAGAIPSASATAGAIPTAGPTGPVQVTLGLYSGRADPTWKLTDAEAASLDAALAGLSEAIGTPPVGGLGYHGFTLARPAGTVVAFDAAVAPPGDGERAYLADPDRTIERLLVETARAHVSGNELAEVERAISAP